jgi:ATP-dependent RNA helicase DeaD
VAELKDAMSSSIFEAFIPLAQELRNRTDGEWLTAFALKYFFTHHRIEKVADLQKAEHKREEHERKEKESGRKEEGRREARGRDRDRRGRDGERRGRSHGGSAPRGDAGPGASDGERRRERGERGEREPRRDGEAAAPREVVVSGAPEGAEAPAAGESAAPAEGGRPQRARIFLSLGEMDGADEAKVREAVAALAPGVEVRAVELRRSHAFVEVSPDALDGAVHALHGKDWNGKPLTAEKARRRRR